MIGTIHEKDSMFLWGFYGTADHKDGTQYELGCCGLGGPGAPIIRNKTTGLWWTINWESLIRLAKEAGIDNPSEPEPLKKAPQNKKTKK